MYSNDQVNSMDCPSPTRNFLNSVIKWQFTIA